MIIERNAAEDTGALFVESDDNDSDGSNDYMKREDGGKSTKWAFG